MTLTKSMLFAMAALCGGPALAGAPHFNNPADVRAITAIEDQLNSQTSMTGLIKYYAPDAVVLDMFSPGLYVGRAQIFKAFQTQFAPVKSMHHQMQEINVASDGRFACSAMNIHFDTTMKNGAAYKITVRQIDAFKKINGHWQIIEEHVSVPADPKTSMAVMDGNLGAQGGMAWPDKPIPPAVISPAQARKEIKTWMVVGAASTSIGQLMQYYGPDDDTLVYDVYAPGELRGLKQISAYYAPLMGSYSSIIVKMPVFYVDSDGAFGVQIDKQDMQLTMKNGSKMYLSLRQSDCMRRVNGKWYSFFEMISYPVDPQTGKEITATPHAFN